MDTEECTEKAAKVENESTEKYAEIENKSSEKAVEVENVDECTEKAAEVENMDECTVKAAEVKSIDGSCNQADDTPDENSSITPTDEYHYLKGGEFSSENFKVIVKNIPSRIQYECFRRAIQNFLGFIPRKVKYNQRNDYAFLAFSNEEERTKAMSTLDKQVWKNSTLICKVAGPMRDPLVRERKRKLQSKEGDSKQQKMMNEENEGLPPEDMIANVVCPYASKPYEEQLFLKEQHIRSCMQKLTNKMLHMKIGRDWMSAGKDKLCLDLLPIIKSPILNNYRNKVEFTIGTGIDGVGNTVGFRLGSYREGNLSIVEPSKCINCSSESVEIGKEFQEFIRSLPHPSYNPATHKGFWQQLLIRSCTTGDVMAIIQVQRSCLSEEELDDLQSKIVDFFSCSQRTVKVSSVFLSSSSQENSNIDTFKHLMGNKFINERLLGLQFRISPDAFFQVNTACAEVLYKTIGDFCNSDQENTCVLDVCCGTGTIGLCLANVTSCEVTGIEISQQAVEDAQYNAEFNGINNAHFICGPAEDVIGTTVRKIKKKNVIAIVDPPRAGLRRNVIETLRACPGIKKIIYVSCSPNQAADNFIQFCRPRSKRFQGEPFKTVRAVPVDLFPHTPHCELIVELARIDDHDNIETGGINDVQHESPVDSEISKDNTDVSTGLVPLLVPVQVPSE